MSDAREELHELRRVQVAAAKLAGAKAKTIQVLEGWDALPDVDAASGELEQAIELLGGVGRDLEDEAERRAAALGLESGC